ncbi:aminotransferase class III-fold pyridoxal phosphate-dependent enzyme [Bdellovibrionota bacterium FG-1]
MTSEFSTQARALVSSVRFQAAKKELLAVIHEASTRLCSVQPPTSAVEGRDAYTRAIQDFIRNRGRDLYYPFLNSGLGNGPFVELQDGSVKYDMISGIGINFFGHTHPEYMSEVVDGLSQDIMQGNLEPGHEMTELVALLLSKVGPKSCLKHGWYTCSGTMANEMALKIIRQKKSPATKIFAFEDCFAGRSTAMQEVTDNPAYRQGQPLYGEVHYLPFYRAQWTLERNIEHTLSKMKAELHRYPGKFAAVMIELVQGEGGFNAAPREWYVRLFEEAHQAGLAIHADEIQTFGRTGELFAFQKFGLEEYVDVVTIGKLLQASLVLYTDEYNPKPGLIAGTFSGSTTALRTGRRTVEMLCDGKHLGKDGKIEKLSQYFVQKLKAIGEATGKIQEVRAVGGMIAFLPYDGTAEQVKALLLKLFDLGVIVFNCGHGPYLVRLLPPLPIMTEQDIDGVCKIISAALTEAHK